MRNLYAYADLAIDQSTASPSPRACLKLSWHVCQPHPSSSCTMYHLAHSTHVDACVLHTTIEVHIHAGAPKIGEHVGHTYVYVDVDHNGSCMFFIF